MNRNANLKILIASEDSEGADRARELSERLATELEEEVDVTNELWKFNLLRHQDVREAAGTSASEADVIILSAHGDGQLPSHVRAWIESWLPQHGSGPSALVALLDHYEEVPGTFASAGSYLRRVAQEANMDFFLMAGGRGSPATDCREAGFPEFSRGANVLLNEAAA